jgi:putative ABC transport system permease protein
LFIYGRLLCVNVLILPDIGDGTGFGITEHSDNNFLIMLKNNIIIAFRLLKRQRIYSAINLIGLSLGMASFLIIVLFYQYQNSYDQFLPKKDRIYRISRYMSENKGVGYISKISSSAAEALNNNVAGIEQTLRLSYVKTELTYKENSFRELFLIAADNSFFEIFDFEMIYGNPKTALSDMNSVVLSESMAKKYFGNESAHSKIISIVDKNGEKVDVQVAGIMKDIPPNSHLIIDAVFSYPTIRNLKEPAEFDNDWALCHTYLLLDENANRAQVEKSVSEIILKNVPDEGFEHAHFPILPVTDIFFDFGKDGGSQRGSKLLTNILLLIGIFILLIASLNYVNLATARSLKRSKEVGIRKVSGANKPQLIYQFIGESVFFSFLAMIMALFLVFMVMPYINNFSNMMYRISLNASSFIEPQFILIALSTAIATGFLSGLYPAFIISSFNPSKSLKGENIRGQKISTKKVLVVAQYVVSIFLVVCCIAIYKVFDHLKNQNFGFEIENIIAVNIDNFESPTKIDFLKNTYSTIDGVNGIASTSKIPLSHRDENSGYVHHEKDDFKYGYPIIYIDQHYFDLLGIKMTKHIPGHSDENKIQNGMYVSQLFMDKYADQYTMGSAVEVFNQKEKSKILFSPSIIGVVEDIKERVLAAKKGPVIFKVDENKLNYLLIKLAPEKQHETIAKLEASFKNQHPYLAFNFTFIEDEMNFMFNTISPFSTLVYYATFFAIIIASMGLFALALFVTQQRTKEVGIRKIFGASELKISMLLAKQYINLILVSFLISGPLTFYGFKWIFMKFPEQIELSWMILFMVGTGLILLALATVFGQSWKAAKSNPVDTLRYE